MKISGKPLSIWKFNNTNLNNLCIKDNAIRIIRKCFELYEKKAPMCQNVWDTAKAELGAALPNRNIM